MEVGEAAALASGRKSRISSADSSGSGPMENPATGQRDRKKMKKSK